MFLHDAGEFHKGELKSVNGETRVRIGGEAISRHPAIEMLLSCSPARRRAGILVARRPPIRHQARGPGSIGGIVGRIEYRLPGWRSRRACPAGVLRCASPLPGSRCARRDPDAVHRSQREQAAAIDNARRRKSEARVDRSIRRQPRV